MLKKALNHGWTRRKAGFSISVFCFQFSVFSSPVHGKTFSAGFVKTKD
jgi:hypothetical protein